jgi:hypothetical protein
MERSEAKVQDGAAEASTVCADGLQLRDGPDVAWLAGRQDVSPRSGGLPRPAPAMKAAVQRSGGPRAILGALGRVATDSCTAAKAADLQHHRSHLPFRLAACPH